MQLPSQLRTDACQALAGAWQNWRGDDLVPQRTQVRIEDIKSWLPNIVVLELRSRREVIFRLAGTRIVESLGVELTGRNYLEFSHPEERATRAERMHQLGQWPCGAHIQMSVTFVSGRSVPSEALTLPVRPAGRGQPIQLFAMIMALEDTTSQWPAADSRHFPTADEGCFVDIGAGAPKLDGWTTATLDPAAATASRAV
ncbi:MAG: PAS domain-containing protein [Alphaproteobacteria bacterium]|jgi:hypothetical protein|nr:PAS domain-containing protein [Alphaproteobacteria bacterium]MDP6564963.1 PAS domain-containing protein [Alphaproteobacteria bacterium]MDP6811813.1 PAS domain-containing protein [Alphaproteobacteria bacterium]